METNLKKRILITGCSSGFGLLIAARLASKGHHVFATMRNLEKKDALLSEVNKRGGQVEVLPLDVTNPESVHQCVTDIVNQHDYIDVLINNAGYGIFGSFEDLTDQEIRDQMETNFFGVLNVTRKVVPIMRQRKSGKIINISSVAGFTASPLFGAYSCSKWALESFSESLRYELGLFGIDVYLIQPGTYQTPIFYENRKEAGSYNDPNSPYYEVSQHLKKRVMNYVDHDCHKDVEEIAILTEKLILSKKAPFRNIPDLESKILSLSRKFLPFKLFSRMVAHHCFKGLERNNQNNQSTVKERQSIS